MPSEARAAGAAEARAATTRAAHPWVARIRAARSYAKQRRGIVGFAVTNERGKVLGGHQLNRTFLSASVVKAFVMTCYLRRGDVRDRALTGRERGLLGPMIRRSDDSATNQLWGSIEPGCLTWIAERERMRGFTTGSIWGRTTITPAGTARFFYEIDRLVPKRHRAYARTLLRTVVPAQRWGLAKQVPSGFTIFFKGGFVGPPGGRVENQGALYGSGTRRFALAVLTNNNPSHAYGIATQRTIARLLLRGYR